MARRMLALCFLSLALITGAFFIGSLLVKPKPIALAPVVAEPVKEYVKPPVNLDSDKLWSLIQEWRQSQGLKPYIKDKRLCVVAQDRADDGFDDHQGLYAKYSDYPYAIQENLTSSRLNEDEALNAWLNSPPHRKTLATDYKYSCVATWSATAVQIFSNF